MKNSTTALIVAAGQSKRFGGTVSKQFYEIDGRPIIYYTLQKFQMCSMIDSIILILPESAIEEMQTSLKVWRMDKVGQIVAGGAERHHSVQNGLAALGEGVEWVAIHDGVRPLVTVAQIAAAIQAAQRHGAAILGVTPRDTIKEINHERVGATLQRQRLIQVQTPQAFSRDIIVRAYRQAFKSNHFSTDDAALVERLGVPVAVVPGDYRNIKVTTPDDVIVVHAYLHEEASS
ncbi:2-C-methyl-D-erythritol 4-phosphate cytidylyltransferase [candidate division KSB1 bacterium]|nr:2-C-methyl-D-erythritol 4-phosphate cytidylyltransferase [candidate division KSB1 bacterium]